MKTIEKQATLIRVDKVAIERTKQGLQDKATSLNKFVEITEKTLKTTLSDKEKIDLKENGLTFVNDWIKPKFKFPDADYSFNLQALGMDLTPIANYWNANKLRLKGLAVELHKGLFIIPNIDNLPEVKRFYYHASNDKQEKAFNEATEICKLLNKLLDKGFIKSNKWQDLADAFEFVRYGSESGENLHNVERRFYPKEVFILKL